MKARLAFGLAQEKEREGGCRNTSRDQGAQAAGGARREAYSPEQSLKRWLLPSTQGHLSPRAWGPGGTCRKVLVAQSCPTLCNPVDPWSSPGKNTGVGCHSLLQRIFPTQELNLALLHCRWILCHLSHQTEKKMRQVETRVSSLPWGPSLMYTVAEGPPPGRPRIRARRGQPFPGLYLLVQSAGSDSATLLPESF